MRTASVLLVGLVGTLGTASGCEKRGETKLAAQASAPVPVTTAKATSVNAPVVLRTIGSVESKARVVLRPQITARVTQLMVEEGSDVRAGQELFKFDARPFEAGLREAEANLARERAMAADARDLSSRVGEAELASAASKRESEEAKTKVSAADADALSGEARVEMARLNLSYCTVVAPFAGRLGQFMIKPGAIVKSDEADMVELTQTDPIEVGFAVPEDKLPAIRAAVAKEPVQVEALPSGESGASSVGTLTFIDSRVDTTTGTIRIKATFANPSRRLWPGQFCNVNVLLGHEPESVMIPESAVQPSQTGLSVFVVKPDQTVELREVKVRRIIDGQSVIERGVIAGETVVTDGQLRLAPGVRVQIKSPHTSEPKADAKGSSRP